MALKDKLMTLEDFKAVRDVDVASNSAQFTEIKADLSEFITTGFRGKKVSIIGDSIDTFNQPGYMISGYNTAYPDFGVENVEQTWWKQVIDATGAVLEVNASWNGSRVTNTHPDQSYPDLYDRISVIGNPDIILIALGTNDSNNNVRLGDYDFQSDYASLARDKFRTAYIKGIKALNSAYPNARIIAIIEKMSFIYKDAIKHICSTLGVEYVDVSNYYTVDGFHPGVIGMSQIANIVLSPMDNTNVELLNNDDVMQSIVPDDAKMLMLASLRNTLWQDGNNNFIDLLKNICFKENNLIQVYPDELEKKVGWNVSYPYFNDSDTRLIYLSWETRITGLHAYRIKIQPLNNEPIAMYINAYNKVVYDNHKTETAITANDHIDLLQGWGELGVHEYTVVAPYSINGSPSYGLVFGIKKDGNLPIASKEIAFCTIKDVTSEIMRNRDLSKGVTILGRELKVVGLLNTNYPYVWHNVTNRLAYAEYDLNVKPGKKYHIRAFAFGQKPICMSISLYNQTFQKALILKQNLVNRDDGAYDLIGGWSSPNALSHTVTIPQTVNGSPSCGLTLLFKYSDDSDINVNAITYITIKEVSD